MKHIGQRHILLVDDYPTVLATLRTVLMDAGYRVTTACTGSVALKRFGEDGKDFDLVLTDFHMPDLNGLRLADKAKLIRDDVAVVVYGDEKHRLQLLSNANVDAVLDCPIDVNRMIDLLDSVLSRFRPRPAAETLLPA